jgi:hypothetical protein
MDFRFLVAGSLSLLVISTVVAAPNRDPDSEPAPIEAPGSADFRPLGAAGPSSVSPAGSVAPSSPTPDFNPLPDRWRIGIPGNYIQNTRNDTLFDPYEQNVLKGDYPLIGQDAFLVLTATSDALFEGRRSPSADNAHGTDSIFLQENFLVSIDLFKGDTAYAPRDWEFRATGVANSNYTHVSEPDDQHIGSFFAPQEFFVDKKLADLSPNFDTLSIRGGIQGFNSDFRGFLFASNEPGVRLYGNYDNNRWQYNLAWFSPLQKDKISLLNSLDTRRQNVFIANLYRQDFLFDGYTAQLSLAGDFDNGGAQFNPQAGQHGTTSAYYIGWAGDGHIGRFNLTHQFYQALGRQSFNPIAGRSVTIDAQFAAIEVSYDLDFVRYRASAAYASGDGNPRNGTATGFDPIFENPNFAGGGFNYWTRQAVALTGTGLSLVNRNGMFPDLRPSKGAGEANFLNPGLFLYNLGADVNVTPRTTVVTNISYLRFDNTAVLRSLTGKPAIGDNIGIDASIGLLYRPLLNNNLIITAGVAGLAPGSGMADLYSSNMLYSVFTGVTVTY